MHHPDFFNLSQRNTLPMTTKCSDKGHGNEKLSNLLVMLLRLLRKLLYKIINKTYFKVYNECFIARTVSLTKLRR